jgi:protein PhnA
MNNEQELLERSGHQCELCGQKENLNVMTVSPKEDALLCCEQCQQKIPDQSLDPD